ncbi:MAG: hypothetical protein AAB638_01625 [Patescibacteria group bacterium]
MLAFTKKEIALMNRLNTPAKIQDFLNKIPKNFERNGKDTVKSPILVLRTNSAHCIEGAMLGAYILSLHGHKPVLMNLASTNDDYDHVIAPFKIKGLWGALSKTNHPVLRYREPVYKTIRELVMSYFHEYFLNNGQKTLKRYSALLNLNDFEPYWMLQDGDLWGIDEELDKIKYYEIAPKEFLKSLRKADPIERKAGKLAEWRNENHR